MRVGGPFLDGWRPALNKLLVFRDGEAVRQMDREDSSVERGGAANTLLCFFCSVISPHQGEGEVSGIPPRNEGLSSFPALPCPGERRRPALPALYPAGWRTAAGWGAVQLCPI